jgi:hypothetical protein
MSKKLLVIFLSMLMAVTLFAVPATAVVPPLEPLTITVNNVNDLHKAMNHAYNGDIVIFKGNLILINANNSNGLTVQPGVFLRIDGNLNVTFSKLTNNGTIIVTGNAGLNGSATVNNGNFYVSGVTRSAFGSVTGKDLKPIVIEKNCTHQIGSRVNFPNFCFTQGYTKVFCVLCDAITIENILPPGEHDWSDWFETIPATDTTDGVEGRHCCLMSCSASETRLIPSTGI